MTLDTHEPHVDVPHYRDRLWSELAHLHEQRTIADADPESRRRRLGAPRSVLVGTAILAAAAAAAVGLVVITPGDGATTREAYLPEPVADRFDPAPGDVVTALLQATERASDSFIVHTVTRYASGETQDELDDWTTHQTRRTERDAQGQPMQEIGGSLLDATNDRFGGRGKPDEVLRIVYHCFQEVEDRTYSGMGGTPGWPFVSQPDDPDVPVSDLTAVVDGSETVDGRTLTRVKVAETGEVLLVDPATSLPVRGTLNPGTPDQIVRTYEYLPRSEANLARLTPPAAPDSYDFVDQGRYQADIDAPAWDPATPIPHPTCPPLP